jgi:hypothetical protein
MVAAGNNDVNYYLGPIFLTVFKRIFFHDIMSKNVLSSTAVIFHLINTDAKYKGCFVMFRKGIF